MATQPTDNDSGAPSAPPWFDDVPPPSDEDAPRTTSREDGEAPALDSTPSPRESSAGAEAGKAVTPTGNVLEVVQPAPAPPPPTTPAARALAALEKKQAAHAKGWLLGGDGLAQAVKLRALPKLPIPAKWPELRKYLRIYPGEILTVIAPTGSGKTQWAIDIGLEFVAETRYGQVLWLPRELDGMQVDLRIVAKVMGRPWWWVREEADETLMRKAYPVRGRWAYVGWRADLVEQVTVLEAGIIEATRCSQGQPPLVVIDTVQLMAMVGKDTRATVAHAIELLRAMFARTGAYGVFVSQSSRGGQSVLRGAVDVDDVRDAVGLGAETASLENASAVVVGLQVMPEDEHVGGSETIALVAKVRNGTSGVRVGMLYKGAKGGQWDELDYVPETKAQTAKRAGKDGLEVDDARARGRDVQRQRAQDRKRQTIAQALAGGPATMRALHARVGGKYPALAELVKVMIEEGVLTHTPDGWIGKA